MLMLGRYGLYATILGVCDVCSRLLCGPAAYLICTLA